MIKSEIQMVRSLGEKRARLEMGLFVAEGEKFIRELIDSSLRVRKIYVTDDAELEDGFDGELVELISGAEMGRISQLKSSNNSLAIVEMPRYLLDVESLVGRLAIVLDGVQNPGNLGTIIRLADWFGIEDIICSPTCADCFNPKVVQATMGAILRVRIHYTDLVPFMERTQKLQIPIYGTFLEGENIYSRELTKDGIIVMGNEGQGVSPEVAQYIDQRLYIPPYPADCQGSESLNVAIATAIVCSEFRRR
ncbi:MAG: RNA methyltransferase [Rikenellaceae bacterium]